MLNKSQTRLDQSNQIKQHILNTLPNKQLKQYLDYQDSHLKQLSCYQRIFQCLKSGVQTILLGLIRSRTVAVLYQKFIDCLIYHPQFIFIEITEGNTYYNGISSRSRFISTYLPILKQLKQPKLLNSRNQQQEKIHNQSIQICKLSDYPHKWVKYQIEIDYENKIIESSNYFTIDLHAYFVRKCKYKSLLLIAFIPLLPSYKTIVLKTKQMKVDDLFQRLEKMAYQCLEEKLIKMIGKDCKAITMEEKQQHLENPNSQRNLISSQSEKQLKQSKIQATINENPNHVDYLKYKHPNNPLTKPNNIKFLTQKDTHFYFQGQFEISKNGELIVINQKKLDQQSNVIKYLIKELLSGAKITQISLPVKVCNNDSNISLLLSSFRHAPIILESAAKMGNPLERFKEVIKYFFTIPPNYLRCDKPFNPFIGQTYQSIVDGTVFCGEQISHKPPISAAFVKGRGYTLYGSFETVLQFSTNSALGSNRGWTKISFHENDIKKSVVRFSNCPGEISGLVFGKRKLNLVRSVFFIDQQNYIFSEIFFGKIKLQKNIKEMKDSIEGRVVKLKKGVNLSDPKQITAKDIQSVYGLIRGEWLSNIYFDNQLLINTKKQHPPQIDSYPYLLKSDYSLRSDIILKRENSEQCQSIKQKLQELQRNDRKLRQKYNP